VLKGKIFRQKGRAMLNSTALSLFAD